LLDGLLGTALFESTHVSPLILTLKMDRAGRTGIPSPGSRHCGRRTSEEGMLIRNEQAGDEDAIRQLVAAAFRNHPHS
jgi:hypothetical protein